MRPEFALMIPAYNGGKLLEGTLRSCLAAGFDPARVAVLVCDNGSDDGSYEAARTLAAGSGGLLHVHRNEQNLGRIGNWNRCLERAEELGAAYGTFLMVGDEWLPGADALAVTAAMRESGAALALARYHIVGPDGRFQRVGRNFVRGERQVVGAREFVRRALAAAALCFGPLQANVYRLDGERRLRFDPADPTHTDQRATLDFLGPEDRPLLLWGRPHFAWKVHPGRFHMAMDVRKRVGDDLALIREQAAKRGIALDERQVDAQLFLLAAREWLGRPNGRARLRDIAAEFRASPGGLDYGVAAGLLFRRLVLRRFFA